LEVFGATQHEKLYLLWSLLFGEQHCMLVSNTSMLVNFVGKVRGLMLPTLLGLELLYFCNYVFVAVHLEQNSILKRSASWVLVATTTKLPRNIIL